MSDGLDGGVRSVGVALDVLETVAFSNEELGVTQIADRLGLTKGSVHRHLLTLVERGYLKQNVQTARYSIGSKSRILARAAPEIDLIQTAEGPMRDLRDSIGQTVVLSTMSPRGALVHFAVPSASPIEIGVRPGSELSFPSSAQGRILLAYSPRPFQERILARDIEKLTNRTITDRTLLEAELGKIVRQGFASAPEETMLGINAVAGPIFDEDDTIIGSVAVVGSIQFLPAEPDEQTVAALKECAEQISRRMGYGRASTHPAPRLMKTVSLRKRK
ncbi:MULTISPECIES: IclR family transcriptional regulator [unclassified Beijerinckia]|uniref:IclR family transcriptional regulator n=1 Tax=unclassified Beijerinckia TaxID=2638183 RepID=UPI00089D20E2|nr:MULTISPECIES: IclR family transcriptional regulator [unclassified Beijerinckia]MDH7795990.1 IclR family KDG regulon transcriptional repressor [Beijerinckia sp. GAS462]SEC25311.1 transcriptional regulator, IclR family [Beijerinckia sp. 28-YEA-48]